MHHKILISLGSNIDKEENTRTGLDELSRSFGEIRVSKVYESESVGFSGDNFYNLVAMAYTSDNIQAVCLTLKTIEARCGRTRQSEKFSSRTLDLDLLTYDQRRCKKPVILPRDEITYNAFVLQPLADLVPDDVHPVLNLTYSQMWQDYDKSKQQLWPVNFEWTSSTSKEGKTKK